MVESIDVVLGKKQTFHLNYSDGACCAVHAGYGRQVQSIPSGTSLTFSVIKVKRVTKIRNAKNGKVDAVPKMM